MVRRKLDLAENRTENIDRALRRNSQIGFDKNFMHKNVFFMLTKQACIQETIVYYYFLFKAMFFFFLENQ